MRQEEVRRKGDIGSKWGLFGNYPVHDPYVGPAVIVEAIKLRHVSPLDDSEQRLRMLSVPWEVIATIIK